MTYANGLMWVFTTWLTCCCFLANGQYVQFALGSGGLDKGQALIRLKNGDLLFGGQTESFGLSQANVLLGKMDPSGRIQWAKHYGGPEREVITDIVITPDSSILMTAEKYRLNAQEGEHLLMIKTDFSGNILWKRVFIEGDSESEGYTLAPSPGGGYVITGIRKELQPVSGSFFTMKREDQRLYLLKIDEQGNRQWSSTLILPDEPVYSTTGMDIINLPDGDFIVTGNIAYRSGSVNARLQDPMNADIQQEETRNLLVMRVNPKGKLLWIKEYSGDKITMGYDLVYDNDGNIYIAGVTNNKNPLNIDILVMKIDPKGQLLWAKSYGTPMYESVGDIILTSDGNLLISGMTMGRDNMLNDAILMKINTDGQLLWSQYYGDRFVQVAYNIAELNDGYVFIGNTVNPQDQTTDVYLVKTDFNGNSRCMSGDISFSVDAQYLNVKTLRNAMLKPVENTTPTKRFTPTVTADNIEQHDCTPDLLNLCNPTNR